MLLSSPLPPPPGHKKAFYGHPEYRGKNALLKINLCGNKDKSFKSKGHQELCRMTLLGSHRTVHLDVPYFTEIRFLTFWCFSILGQRPINRRKKDSEIRSWYVSLIEVKHEVKPTSMIKCLNMSFTSFTPDFLWAKKFQNQILYISVSNRNLTASYELCSFRLRVKSIFFFLQ